MITKLLIMLVLFGGTILIMIVIWRRFYATGKSHTLSNEMIASLEETLSCVGLPRRQLRRWAGQRSLNFHRTSNELVRELELELIDGFFEDYLRLHLKFEAPLEQGVSILTEDRLGFVSTLLRAREVSLGHKHLDRKFVLLAQDEARLRALLDHDKLDEALLSLQDQVDELVLTDESLFVLVSQIPSPQECVDLIIQLDLFTNKLVEAATRLGPIAQPGVMDYTEVMSELGTRDDLVAASQTELDALSSEARASQAQVVDEDEEEDAALTSSVRSEDAAASSSS